MILACAFLTFLSNSSEIMIVTLFAIVIGVTNGVISVVMVITVLIITSTPFAHPHTQCIPLGISDVVDHPIHHN